MRTVLLSVVFVGVCAAGAIAQSLPPKPDFERRVDYVAWYDKAVGKPSPNAYDAYAKFIPGMIGGKAKEESFPKFEGMFSNPDAPEPPAPWDPKEHPDWEASYQRTQKILKDFESATQVKNWAAPSGLSTGRDSFDSLLMNRRLPYLTPLRQCARGLFEAAWRRDKDGVSKVRLQEAIAANLRLARQLDQGYSALEFLTGSAVREFAYDNAAWGFAHNVFAPADAAGLQKVIQEIDGRPVDARPAFAGEAAMAYDALQYVFGPLGGGGETHVDPARMKQVTGVQMGFNRAAFGSRIESNAAGCADGLAEAFAAMNSALGESWSARHLAPINQACEKAAGLNQLMRNMPPLGLMSVYRAGLRAETARRAGQLLVEVFSYKSRKNKWPPKLDNLNKKTTAAITDDPWSGKPFAYKIAEGKPLFYSVGDNGQDDGGKGATSGPGGVIPAEDWVFWPLVGSGKTVAAAKLKGAKAETITPLAKLAEFDGREVTVVAKVVKVEGRPSRQHRRIYSVTLAEGATKATLVYYADTADALSAKQEIKAGLRVRVAAIVTKDDKGVHLLLKDADHLVVEKDEGKP